MCGIHFIQSFEQALDDDEVRLMVEKIKHRGPDASQTILIDSKTAISHHRLSIIDPSKAANQPYVVNNRYYLSYNGEIYNYKKLRKQLEQNGVCFNTDSDTEVVAQSLIHYGENAQSHFEGMFAYVWYDRLTQEIITGRDPSGIKPLYIKENKNSLTLTSEIKACQMAPLSLNIISKELLNNYFNYKYIGGSDSPYQQINQIKAGECKVYRNSQWHTVTHTNSTRLKMPFNLKQRILESGISDVPMGLFLSGGIDSLIIYHCFKENSIPLTCFYINIDNDLQEESRLQKLTNKYGDQLHIVDFHKDLTNNLIDYLGAIDHPVADSAGFLTWLLAKKAKKEGIKVTFSGAGADELFAGYNRHLAFNHILHWSSFFPVHFLKYLPITPFYRGDKKRLVNKLLSSIKKSPSATWDQFIRLNLSTNQTSFSKVESLEAALEHDRTNYLIDDILSITDRASMAHGVEVRLPFLHPEIIKWVKNKTVTEQLLNGKKSLLKDWLDKRNIKFESVKKGFGLPLTNNLQVLEPLKSSILKLKEPSHPVYYYLDYKRIRNIIKKHEEGSNNYSSELWALIIFDHWYQNHEQN